MEKMHIIFDADKCVGCFNCLLSCQDEFIGNDWLPYTESQEKHGEKWIKTTRHERGRAPITEVAFVTEMCRHCQNAPCEKAFPDAVIRRDDGIVLLNARKARGNRELVKACPYGMIHWNEERQTAQKCTMCAHLLDEGWSEPRCVQACPLRALSVVKCTDEEFALLSAKQHLKPLEPGSNKPRLLVRNLYKVNTVYIYGAIVTRKDGVERAIGEANIVLSRSGEFITSAITDFFGEFKLDRLPKNSGEFELTVSVNGVDKYRRSVTVGEECPDVGVICID